MPLTNATEAPFADDKHDYQSTQPSYDFAGSITEGEVFIKEKVTQKKPILFYNIGFFKLKFNVLILALNFVSYLIAKLVGANLFRACVIWLKYKKAKARCKTSPTSIHTPDPYTKPVGANLLRAHVAWL